ncbi:unnamed protein product [Ectocarpus fasciculatus]
MFTMSALVQSGQWGRARSLVEVMAADGMPPKVGCYSHLLTLLHTRLASRLPDLDKDVQVEESLSMSSLSPVDQAAFLWSEPTYEWDEVVSLLGDARSTERAKYGITEDMYHTALDVLQIISERPVDVSLGVVDAAATVPPPPPAKVFLDRAECLLEWALDAVR